MPRLADKIQDLLALIGRQLALCCHRDVGNLPTLPRREPRREAPAGLA